MLSYTRFVNIILAVIISLSSYLTVRLSESTRIAFIDSTKILLMSAIAEERGQKSGGNCSNNVDRIVVKVSLR